MFSYLRLFFLMFFFSLSVIAISMEQGVNDQSQPKNLVQACLSHFARVRASKTDTVLHDHELQVDANTVQSICKGITVANIAKSILKALPEDVIKNNANDLVQGLKNDISDKTKVAIIKKLAKFSLIKPYRNELQKICIDSPTKTIINALNHYDSLFLLIKSFLIRLFYIKLLPEYREATKCNSLYSGIYLSPDGKYLAEISHNTRTFKSLSNNGGANDKIIKIYTIDGKLITTLDHQSKITALAWSPNNKHIATGGLDNSIKIWTMDGTCVAILSDHIGIIHCLAWSCDSKSLASGAYDLGVKIWTLDGTCIETLPDYKIDSEFYDTERVVSSLAWINSGEAIAIGSTGGIVKIWNRKDRVWIAISSGYHGERINVLSWSPNDNYLAIGYDTIVEVWNRDKNSTSLIPHLEPIELLRWSGNSDCLVSGSTNVAKILDLNKKGVLCFDFDYQEEINQLFSFIDCPNIYLGIDCTNHSLNGMDLLMQIIQYPFSYNDIVLITNIAKAKAHGTKYQLDMQYQKIFDQLAAENQELQSMLLELLKPYVNKDNSNVNAIPHVPNNSKSFVSCIIL